MLAASRTAVPVPRGQQGPVRHTAAWAGCAWPGAPPAVPGLAACPGHPSPASSRQHGWGLRPGMVQPVPPPAPRLPCRGTAPFLTHIWMVRGCHRVPPCPQAHLSRTSWGCSYAGCVIPPLWLSQFRSCRLRKPAMLTQSSSACAIPKRRHPVSKTAATTPSSSASMFPKEKHGKLESRGRSGENQEGRNIPPPHTLFFFK